MATTINRKIRNAEYYKVQAITDDLYSQAKCGKSFSKLIPLIASEDNIILAYRNIKKNNGSKTPGVDGLTIDDFGKMDVDDVVNLVRNKLGHYAPRPVKRVEIPKSNGKTRPLGIPCMVDRLVQQCILQVLEPICEAKFYNHSYGFRPGRATRDAIARTNFLMQKVGLHHVVDVDIVGFFDNVNHTKLLKQLWSIGIHDKKLLSILKAMLTARIQMPDGSVVLPDKGTPQGGILSPLLANVVLNELDWWIASQWELFPTKHDYSRLRTDRKKPFVDLGNKMAELKKTSLKEMYIVRYADDFKVFCRSHEDAEKAYHAIKQWIGERLQLEISPEKSGITDIRKKYTSFLGFEIKVIRKGKKWVVSSNVSKKALARVRKELKDLIVQIQKAKDGKTLFELVNQYNATVMGVHGYYSVATNVAGNFRRMGSELHDIWHTRCRSSYSLTKKGELPKGSSIEVKYGSSSMLRFINGRPIVPIGAIRTNPPMSMNQKKTPYTPEGRELMHKKLGVDLRELRILMSQKVGNESLEYYDNRVSLYCAQYGKCAVTRQHLQASDVHCHHKIPKDMGGSDAYDNLIIVSRDIHILIHAVKVETINQYLYLLGDEKQLQKLNGLRKKCGLSEIDK